MQPNTGQTLPAISVVLPVYNGAAYLQLSVESVLNQSFQNFELLIIDDCSQDDSPLYLDQLADPRIKVFKNDHNQGLFFNLNFLIRKSGSPLIKLWAQDDVMYPNCLERFVAFHLAHPGIGFSYSGRDIIDQHGVVQPNNLVDETPEIVTTALHTRIAYYTGSIAGNIANVCINKDALEQVGLFNEKMKISADFDMWVRLAEHHTTGFISERLIQLRNHPLQLSNRKSLYIHHIEEDLQVYQNLNSYASSQERASGKKVMRHNKLIFYYTLMLKELAVGNFGSFYKFASVISKFDNLLTLSYSYFLIKVFKNNQSRRDRESLFNPGYVPET